MENERLAETVVKARQGDSSALRDIYLDMYKGVYYLALKIVKNPEDAEDITQEVYITIQEKIADLREPAAFFGWANTIAARKCYRLLRDNKGTAWLEDEEALTGIEDDDPANMPDKAIDDEATRKIILEVIDALPDGQRTCVMLYYYSRLTVEQIADALEINENTVASRLYLARAKIRAALEEKEKKEGIKLWGIPLSLAEVLQESFENYAMPSETEARIRQAVSEAAEPPDENIGGSPGQYPQLGDGSPEDIKAPEIDNADAAVTDSLEEPKANNAEQPGKDSVAPVETKTAKKLLTPAAKIIIGIIAAAVVIAGIIIITLSALTGREATPPDTAAGAEATPGWAGSQETGAQGTPDEAAEPEPSEDEQTIDIDVNNNRAPAPSDLRLGETSLFGVNREAVFWDVPSQNERIRRFEFSAAKIGSDEWEPFYSFPAENRETLIERIAAYLDEGEYRLRITALPSEGYEPSEPAYFDNWTLTVKSGRNANAYSLSVSDSEYGERVYINGIDENYTVFFVVAYRNGGGDKFVTGYYNTRGDFNASEPIWFEKNENGMQTGDMITIRELIGVENNGTNHTVTFMKTSGPIEWP